VVVGSGVAGSEARIGRSELTRNLDAALDAGTVVLVAGAGFGKTMALEGVLAARGEAPAWVRCDESDGYAAQLLWRIVRAIGSAVPGTMDVLEEWLAGAPFDASSGARLLVSELAELLVEPLVLVFDDAEHLDGSPAALDLVGGLVEAEIDRLSVAIATRRRLPLDQAIRRSRRMLREFGPADLAFSAEECARLIAARTGTTPSQTETDEIMELTEGWPLGVVLQLAVQGHSRARPNDELSAFLTEEVLDRLDPQLRRMVLRSSVPHQLSPATVQALQLPERFHETAQEHGLLLSTLEGDAGILRWHPLVRAVLLERVRAEFTPPEWRGIHADVAASLEAQGQRVEAIEHWLRAERWDDAVDAMLAQGNAMFALSPERLRGWFQGLPDDVRARADCRLLEGRVLFRDGLYVDATDPLRDAVRGLRTVGDAKNEWAARRLLGYALFEVGGWDELVELADGFDGPETWTAGADAPATALAASEALRFTGRPDEARELFERARRHPASAELAPLFERTTAYHMRTAGELEAALARLRQAASSTKSADPLAATSVNTMLGNVLTDTGQYADALQVWADVIELSTREGSLSDVKYAHHWRAYIHTEAGDLHEAEAELARASEIPTRGWGCVPDLVEAVIASKKGANQDAVGAAERALAIAGSEDFENRTGVVSYVAPVLELAGAGARARQAVDDGLKLCDETHAEVRGRFVPARLLLLRAWLCYRDGDHEAADRGLEAAWTTAGRAFAHVLRPDWARVQQMVWSALERGSLDARRTMRTLQQISSNGDVLLRFAEHPSAGVREQAIRLLFAEEHPYALQRLGAYVKDENPVIASAARALRKRVSDDPPPLRFGLLGGFTVRRGEWPIDPSAWRRPVAARLVRFLLVNRDRPIHEDVLLEMLWRERSVETARRSLRVAVSQARAVLDLPGASRSVVDVSDHAYRLALGPADRVDADQFEQLAATALAARGADRSELLREAAETWTGPPLPEDSYADWASPLRNRLIARYQEVLLALAADCGDRRDYFAATDAAHKLLTLDPLDERAHRELMLANVRAGRTAHALRQYLACRRLVVDALGVEPESATTELHGRILAGQSV
jgi:DNA-binding SARP family transcriptional activator/tetratricopeptide (TPR) repeat protein